MKPLTTSLSPVSSGLSPAFSEPSFILRKPPQTFDYILKQSGSLTIPYPGPGMGPGSGPGLSVRLELCVLCSKVGNETELVFFNFGPGYYSMFPLFVFLSVFLSTFLSLFLSFSLFFHAITHAEETYKVYLSLMICSCSVFLSFFLSVRGLNDAVPRLIGLVLRPRSVRLVPEVLSRI
jgi:hypothetical protein